ncbi:MAG: HK97 gp10 family phage protein [Chitinispirillaceae bacterium]|nr:HK97 gp10 family phage protein [Chitinispirillaceae bacterium]
MSKFKFTSYLKDVQRDLDKGEKRNRKKAAAHLVSKLKENLSKEYPAGTASPPGAAPGLVSGDYKKGIGSKDIGNATLVGVGPPAYHAHLLEFGTEDRFTKDGTFRGRVEPRPVVYPTFEAEADEVKKILSEPY